MVCNHLMKSQNQYTTAPIPEGKVGVSGLLYGSVGLALSFALYWIGMFRRADAWFFDLLHEAWFSGGVPHLASVSIVVIVAAIFCYGVAFAMLDSAATWRRFVLGVTALVLTLAMVPAFAVWNVYFSPFVPVVGVFWSWFCVLIYTRHHQMPCDCVHVDMRMSPPEPELLQPVDKPINKPVVIERPHALMGLEEAAEDKYKPSLEKEMDGVQSPFSQSTKSDS